MTTPPADLGEEWIPGPDGIPFRSAARVILLDAEGSILLFEAHDDGDHDHRWWFTVGGGIATGEDARTAAVRELVEETGLAAEPDDLIGPIANRSATFPFARFTVRQDEEFFLLQLTRVRPAISGEAWTELEQRSLDQVRWLSAAELDELIAAGNTVYPEQLPELFRAVQSGWDGQLWELREQRADAG